MHSRTLGVVALACFALSLVGGCAKKEMVKPDQAAPPAAAAPASPAPQPAQPREEPVKAQTIPEAPVAVASQTSDTSGRAEAAETSLERIYFEFDAFVLSQTARDTLSRNAEALLKKMPNAKVSIEGHCDERGSDEYNLALGEKRAKAAMSYLITLGVPAARLSIISYGEEKPLDPGHSEEAWAKNRRAEFVIVK